MKANGQRKLPCNSGLWTSLLLSLLTLGVPVAAAALDLQPLSGVVPGIFIGLLLLGMTASGHEDKRIKAGIQHRGVASENAFFTLHFDSETVTLEPGKTWLQLDHYKWVVRGLIEAPQNFHVHPDGSVEIYAEKINIADPDGTAKLEEQINKRLSSTIVHKPAPAHPPSHSTASQSASGKPRFRVKLDHWGHMVIEWGEGIEREETGMRGLTTLIANGLIRKPRNLHVDPLQRGIEIDGVNFDCSEAGAKRLEEALNTRYVVTRQADKAVAIEIKENHAASTGFDIHFTIHRTGVPLEIKGHLSQEHLDILQDPAKCDLLQPSIHLMLAPPYLLIRKRRPDMGEDRIPEVPDVNILHCNAAQLQEVLNHPFIRRKVGAGTRAVHTLGARGPDIIKILVVRNPEDKVLLWLKCVADGGAIQPAKAFTHHNIAELQQSGLFLPHLSVRLSLDHRQLSIQNRDTRQEETLTLDARSPEEDLHKAGQMLTAALKPPTPRSEDDNKPAADASLGANAEPAAADKQLAPAQPKEASAMEQHLQEAIPGIVAAPSPEMVTQPQLDPAITALFGETDAVRINMESFRRLVEWLEMSPREIHLSLPFVFENRRFDILSFENQEITDLAQLRGVEFYGFYLSHISEKKIVLVYACNGMHIEWGPDKCVLQPTATSEATEYKGSALLGLAQDQQDGFVFIVQPAFKQWIEPREKPYLEESVHFLTVPDIAKAPSEYKFIWPERQSMQP